MIPSSSMRMSSMSGMVASLESAKWARNSLLPILTDTGMTNDEDRGGDFLDERRYVELAGESEGVGRVARRVGGRRTECTGLYQSRET